MVQGPPPTPKVNGQTTSEWSICKWIYGRKLGFKFYS